jgi:hypothetical protein
MYLAMNKILNKNNQSEQQTTIKDEIKVWKCDKYYLPASIFILSGLYFYLFGNYIFFYQENFSLFVFSCDYLEQFASKPGGLLEYAGNFLSQFYFSAICGALILAVLFTSVAIIFYKINRKLSADRPFSLLFPALTSCILILAQTNINYLIHNNLGFLLTGLFFLFSISAEKKGLHILILALFPLFYYLTGAFAWIFLGMFILYNLFRKKVIYPVCLLVIAGLSLLLFKNVIFLQPWSDLLYYPLPLKGYFNNPMVLWFLFLFFVFYPFLLSITRLINIQDKHKRTFPIFAVILPILLTILILYGTYNKGVVDLFKLEEMFIAKDWNGVIKEQEKSQSRNPVAQYYYNVALSENGMLCDRLFFAPQDYGSKAISIAWNSQIPMNKMFRGVYFYYSIGLINEAHRWAFESMVIQGYRPENIKLLIKTDLINGHYKVAEKYISVLKKTLHYRSLAKRYEAMLLNPELIKSDPELGEKIRLKPQDDFIITIRNPQKNIASLLQSNPGNKKAFEYNMAWLMLEKNIVGVVDEMYKLTDLGYSKIPRHVEEAAIIFKSNAGLLPELNTLKISNETESRFSEYLSTMKYVNRKKTPVGSGIKKELKNTYWYYLDSR